MVQHQLLIYVSAVLFLRGLPPWLFGPMASRPGWRAILRVVAHPISCGLIYVLVLSVWHAPRLYDGALQNKNVHVIEHLMFFGAALFYWWPILSPSSDLPRASFATQIMYLLAVTIGMTPVFAFIAFSDNVLYPTYEYAPRLFETLDPAEDQKLGAAVMKIGDIIVTISAMLTAFYHWYQSSERER
jgi:putative membrane protein